MKKCATIIFYSALFLLFSCTDSKKERIATNAGTQQEQADNKVLHHQGSRGIYICQHKRVYLDPDMFISRNFIFGNDGVTFF